MRRVAFGVAWVVGAFFAWGLLCRVWGFVVFEYLWDQRGVRFPGGIVTVYNIVAGGGVLVIPVVMAVLAMRGRLPWTGRRPAERAGFPVGLPVAEARSERIPPTR